MLRCPFCGSDDVDRIGLYEYRCNSCEETYDASETDSDQGEWYPD